MKKYFLFFVITLTCVFSLFSQIVINEYSAANYSTFTDNYGEYEDWIELYNTASNAVDISGWYISDKSSNPTKWSVPGSFIIPANGVALLYCSGRDELVGGNAHTNFKITQTKNNETIIISDAAGVFQDSVQVIPNQESHSRGREVNGSAVWSVFVSATPGANNTNAMQEYAATPVFSQNPGYYSAPINLVISSADPNATIYYTTNGDSPDNTSNIYTGPINIAVTSVVKAIAYSSNQNVPPSFIEYSTFFINDTHTIPILSISGDNGQSGLVDLLDGGWGSSSLEPKGAIEWFDKNGILLDKGTGEFNKHGNDSWAYDQRGFDYVMRDQFGYNYALQDKIFYTKDRDKFQRVIVKAAANDNYPFSYGGSGAHIRDAYIQHLSQIGDLRMDERSTSSCIVYLNGEYWGVYEIREKVDDHDFTDHYYDQDRNNLQYLKTWGGTWTEYGAPNAQIDWDNFVNFVTTNPMTIQANYNQAKSEYNMGSLIDYFLLNTYTLCQDWLNWNTAWWRGMDPAGDKKKWRYTLWDMDNTFDHGANYTNIPSSDPNAEPCDPSTLGNTGGQGHVPIWNEMLTNQEFHDDYINRWQDLANGPLSCDFMIQVLDSMIAVIDPEMPRQIAKWGGTYIAWQNNVTTLRNFILARCDSINAGFVACDSAITGIYDVTVEVIGNGEIEMSNGNIINQNNSGWTDERFGGVDLPFEVKSGPFKYWEVLPQGVYVYDPLVDTLVLDLQGNAVVRAYFTPTRNITYDVFPPNTTTTIDVDGINISTFPETRNYFLGDTIAVSSNIDPLYGFSYWSSDSILLPFNMSANDSFFATHHDTIRLNMYLLPTVNAFIEGNDTVCRGEEAFFNISFNGTPPYTFTYAVNGDPQLPIITTSSSYTISATEEGSYTLVSFSDANEPGSISGSALLTLLESPEAGFVPSPDSMTVIYTTTTMVDTSKPTGFIDSWWWNFGDGIGYDSIQNPTYTYSNQDIATYAVSLTVTHENGCQNTKVQNVIVTDEYWMYIPNSFTPDDDLINDKFCIDYRGVLEETFMFNIYSRFGELVYSTTNIRDLKCDYLDGHLINGWDGTDQNTGSKLPGSVYIYEIYYQDHREQKHQDVGHLLIVR